jgi:gamma-glutamylcyclotransferase (GGCT)/AIG2-like uncharacterized protein YtfP
MKYFAYASNMSAEVIDAACGANRFLAPARLPGHRLAFTRRSVLSGTGVAVVVADPGSEVWGALYELESRALERLDRKEGRGFAYRRRAVTVVAVDGTPHRAVAYSVISREPVEIRPSPSYLQGLLAGAGERSLPGEYIASLEALLIDWNVT